MNDLVRGAWWFAFASICCVVHNVKIFCLRDLTAFLFCFYLGASSHLSWAFKPICKLCRFYLTRNEHQGFDSGVNRHQDSHFPKWLPSVVLASTCITLVQTSACSLLNSAPTSILGSCTASEASTPLGSARFRIDSV